MSGEYDRADNYALLQKELEDCERVLINTRNLAATKAAGQKSKIDELEHQIIVARTPGPATRAMLKWVACHPAHPSSELFQAFLVEWSTPATPPAPEQPEPSSPWTCCICGEAVRIADDLKPRHLRPDINRAHAAELSDEDLKILADGLRLTD